MTEASTSQEVNAFTEITEDDAPNAVPPEPSVVPASVEWDHSGRVISSKFSNGHVCRFRYDANGNLYAFTYAKLAWSTIDGINWTSHDQVSDWAFVGKVSVGVDGTIRIEHDNVSRTLKLNGMIVDEFPDSTMIETLRPSLDVTPEDLLATSESRAHVTAPVESNVIEVSDRFADAPAGEPPSAKDAGAKDDTSRRVVIGGRRINRLRNTIDEAESTQTPSLLAEAKDAFDNFVTNSTLQLIEKAKGTEALELAPLLERQAQFCLRQRRMDEARNLFERAFRIRAIHQGSDHSETGISRHGLGRIYHDWGRFAEAEQEYLDAVKVFAKGLRKVQFLCSTGIVGGELVKLELRRLVEALHSLSSLYHEQSKLHLCNQLYESAAAAVNTVEPDHRSGISASLDSLAAMAAQAELSGREARFSAGR